MSANKPSAYLHADSGAVRFWVRVNELPVGASVPSHVLRYLYQPDGPDGDALALYLAHAEALAEAVRRRVAGGSIEPVMLRQSDLDQPPG
ncbi:hypothetical protein [Ideonella sp.]|jgi:hypothetical protein|uniref:hypothetical protein n=1 Tax=Ideonella sp. TaxID=1929293 RepID=UPI0037C189C9